MSSWSSLARLSSNTATWLGAQVWNWVYTKLIGFVSLCCGLSRQWESLACAVTVLGEECGSNWGFSLTLVSECKRRGGRGGGLKLLLPLRLFANGTIPTQCCYLIPLWNPSSEEYAFYVWVTQIGVSVTRCLSLATWDCVKHVGLATWQTFIKTDASLSYRPSSNAIFTHTVRQVLHFVQAFRAGLCRAYAAPFVFNLHASGEAGVTQLLCRPSHFEKGGGGFVKICAFQMQKNVKKKLKHVTRKWRRKVSEIEEHLLRKRPNVNWLSKRRRTSESLQ